MKMGPEFYERHAARHLLTETAHRAERVLGIRLPWVLTHIDDELTPEVLADHIAGYGVYKPVDVPYEGRQEGPVLWARDENEFAEKLGSSKTPLVIVSGTSTSGQNTIVAETMKKLASAGVICDRVMTTTDKEEIRPGETDYYERVSANEFDNLLASDAFIESMQRKWGRFGTRITTLEASLTASDLVFLNIDNDGSRNVMRWMQEYCPDHSVTSLFNLAKTSPLTTAVNIMTKRPLVDWIPRLGDTIRLIQDAGANPTFDAVISNLQDAGGVPIRTPQALATLILSNRKTQV